MKKKLTITSVILGLSVVAGSAYAASNTDMLEAAKSNFASSTETISKEKAMKSGDYIDLEQMAKEKGMTVEKLIAQLEKEGKLTKAAQMTEAINVEQMAKEKGITVEKLIAQLEKEGEFTEAVQSTEAVDLEQMAKEKGITVEKLIEQLEKEGKLTNAAATTDAVPATASEK